MPIAPQFRYLYSGKEWKEKRAAALARAGNRCERCQVPNKTLVQRRMVRTKAAGCRAWWRLPGWDDWYNEAGFLTEPPPPEEATREWTLWVVLTVAHVDHQPENMDNENLEALCCRCHIMHDRSEHANNARETRRGRKDRARPLLALIAGSGMMRSE